MALTAAQAHKRAADLFFDKFGVRTVERLEKLIDAQAKAARLSKARNAKGHELDNIELSFNEAAGVLAVSTAQLEMLLKNHPRKPPLFEVKGMKKRTTRLLALLEWRDKLRMKGAWLPLTARGAAPDALLTAKLPFLVSKGGGAKQVFLEPLVGDELSDETLARIDAILRREVGVGVRVCTLSQAFQHPWQDAGIKAVWRASYDKFLVKHLDRLEMTADRLRKERALLKMGQLEEAWGPGQPATRIEGDRRL